MMFHFELKRMFQELIERAYGKMYKIAYLIASPCKKNPPLFLTDAINKEHMLKCHVQKLQVTWCLQKKKNGGGARVPYVTNSISSQDLARKGIQ